MVQESEDRELALIAEPYGWTLTDRTGEWAITCRWTSRQDGKASWMVCMTDVDGEVRVKQGMDLWPIAATNMRQAAKDFTSDWIIPITSLVLPDWATPD